MLQIRHSPYIYVKRMRGDILAILIIHSRVSLMIQVHIVHTYNCNFRNVMECRMVKASRTC